MRFLEALKPTQVVEDLPPEEIKVGLLASITLHHTVVFIVCQLLINMALMVPLLMIPAVGWYTEKTGEMVTLIFLGVVEFVFMLLLAIDGRKRYRNAITRGDPRLDVISEPRLEAAGGGIAIIMFVASYFYGFNSFALHIMLTVGEFFAFAFMFVFVVTRFALTRRVRLTGLASLIALGIAFYRLLTM